MNIAKLTSKSRVQKLQQAFKSAGGDVSKIGDDDFRTLVALRKRENDGKRFVAVAKVALREGEELWDFVMAISSAVQENRVTLANGSLDIWIEGIYEDSVIVQDFNTGKFFKAAFTRKADGTFTFGEPVEVRATFVEVTEPTAPAAGEAEKAVTKAAPTPTYVEVGKAARGKWSTVLGG